MTIHDNHCFGKGGYEVSEWNIELYVSNYYPVFSRGEKETDFVMNFQANILKLSDYYNLISFILFWLLWS